MKKALRGKHLEICPCGSFAGGFLHRPLGDSPGTRCCSMLCLDIVANSKGVTDLQSILSQAEEHAVTTSIPDIKGALANLLDTPQDEINDDEVRTVIELVLDVVRRKRANIAEVINKRGPRRHG